MQKYKLIISFVGTNFCGWQSQRNGKSVCETLNFALEKLYGSFVPVCGCSRTDAGVHAVNYCCHIVAPKVLPCENIISALNHFLPNTVRVLHCELADDDFHARYSSKGKRYIYKIDNSMYGSPFYSNLAYHYKKPLDAVLMNEKARLLVGKYDFTAFCSADSNVEDKVRTIYDCRVDRDGDFIYITVSGDGFLYNMVRIISGTLLKVGVLDEKFYDIEGIIASGDRTKSGPTLSACGLYLDEVFY